MGKVVWLEAWRLNKLERVRQEALACFSWGKLSRLVENVLEPTTRSLSPHKRFVVDEAVYRLAFESYIQGIQFSRRGAEECPPNLPFTERRNWYNRCFREEGDHLVGRIAEEMELFFHVDEWTCQSVLLFFDEVAIRWFLEGIDFGIQLRKRRLL
ncbi:hypothetical protein [Desmospora profundinema]|uniref:Uncharacterized protein n=1 Tax=Desmospora profundinema TaxID=1571184 RepID=A0ABU1IQ46_9BACL|nr:hypothetical protein [Desmospora profundinema]MDR6226921.1 hypothetical protein [Desmospora profundinema]